MSEHDDESFAPASILQQLRLGVRQGLALASLAVVTGCTETDAPPDHPTPDASQDADTPTDAPPRPELVPYALDKLGCFGPSHDAGFYGQCCVSPLCYTPAAGSACAAADAIQDKFPSDDFGTDELDGLPPGSGTCACAFDGIQTGRAGPFAPNPRGTAPAGECCYLVGSISCTGRPLMVAGRAVIAQVVARRDWALFA
jgi:hypothetical protein